MNSVRKQRRSPYLIYADVISCPSERYEGIWGGGSVETGVSC
jgi:hypothetical protein